MGFGISIAMIDWQSDVFLRVMDGYIEIITHRKPVFGATTKVLMRKVLTRKVLMRKVLMRKVRMKKVLRRKAPTRKVLRRKVLRRKVPRRKVLKLKIGLRMVLTACHRHRA